MNITRKQILRFRKSITPLISANEKLKINWPFRKNSDWRKTNINLWSVSFPVWQIRRDWIWSLICGSDLLRGRPVGCSRNRRRQIWKYVPPFCMEVSGQSFGKYFLFGWALSQDLRRLWRLPYAVPVRAMRPEPAYEPEIRNGADRAGDRRTPGIRFSLTMNMNPLVQDSASPTIMPMKWWIRLIMRSMFIMTGNGNG